MDLKTKRAHRVRVCASSVNNLRDSPLFALSGLKRSRRVNWGLAPSVFPKGNFPELIETGSFCLRVSSGRARHGFAPSASRAHAESLPCNGSIVLSFRGDEKVRLIDIIPVPAEPTQRKRGRSKTYPQWLFLKALVIMIVQQVHTPSGLLAILAQPTAEMQVLRQELSLADGRFACRRTWERRLASIPSILPAQIACLGCFLLELLGVWIKAARAAAIARF